MRNMILTAAALATMLGIASTEALALRLMGPDNLQVDQGLVILAPTGKTGVVRGGLAPVQAELQQIKNTDVFTGNTIRTEVISPETDFFTNLRQSVLQLLR